MDFELFRATCSNLNISNDQILDQIMAQKRAQKRSFTKEEISEICQSLEVTGRKRLLTKFTSNLERHKELA